MAYITLTRGKVARVDDADEPAVAAHKWHAIPIGKAWYAATNIDGKRVYMHRLLMNPAQGMSVDHLDDDGLNNMRGNLRLCTHQENLSRQRTVVGESGFRGVTRHKNSWKAKIRVHYKNIYLGCFKDKIEAAQAYDRAAVKYFGPHARLNLP
jgi:hypothetical protein